MGATWRSRPTDVYQQIRMRFGNIEVVGLDRDGLENCRHKILSFLSPASFRQLDADAQLRHGNRRDRDVIAIVDRFLQRVAAALGLDQDRGVEDQSRQGSVTGSMPSRSSRSSPAQASSGR